MCAFGAFVDVFALLTVLLGGYETGQAGTDVATLGQVEAIVFATAAIGFVAYVVVVATQFV